MRLLREEDTDSGELIDIDEFIDKVVVGEIDSFDGYCKLVYYNEIDDTERDPSDVAFHLNISEDVTEVLWFPI
jgi:hypothetical protein